MFSHEGLWGAEVESFPGRGENMCKGLMELRVVREAEALPEMGDS